MLTWYKVLLIVHGLQTGDEYQLDPWQVVLRQVFTPYSRLLISSAFVVVSRVGVREITGVGTILLLAIRWKNDKNGISIDLFHHFS